MKLIGCQAFENQVFVQCCCGQEIVEFCRDGNVTDDGSIEYFIRYHGYFNPKVETNYDFSFSTKAEFAELISKMKDCLSGLPCNDPMVILDKYLTRKNKAPGVLVVVYDANICALSIIKFRDLKAAQKSKKSTWEIVIDKAALNALVQELEEWK